MWGDAPYLALLQLLENLFNVKIWGSPRFYRLSNQIRSLLYCALQWRCCTTNSPWLIINWLALNVSVQKQSTLCTAKGLIMSGDCRPEFFRGSKESVQEFAMKDNSSPDSSYAMKANLAHPKQSWKPQLSPNSLLLIYALTSSQTSKSLAHSKLHNTWNLPTTKLHDLVHHQHTLRRSNWPRRFSLPTHPYIRPCPLCASVSVSLALLLLLTRVGSPVGNLSTLFCRVPTSTSLTSNLSAMQQNSSLCSHLLMTSPAT